MRTLLGFGLGILAASSLCAQYRGGIPASVLSGGFGNVVYPGGTSATMPNIQRFTPSASFPGGGGPHFNSPFNNSFSRPTHRNSGTVLVPYAVPVYMGGYGLYDAPADGAVQQQQQQQQPNVTVIYPPQPAPVIINQYGTAGSQTQAQTAPPEAPVQSLYVSPSDETANTPPPAEATPYLIAFKDHTIYSAVAYWVDGDTIHYFTSGNTHNQASLSLVDRALTERLNRESGREVLLPQAK